jgi:sugar phosphate isomerase/epimerase
VNLAASNIAWDQAEEAQIAELLHSRGITRVEIAPTKVFADPTSVSETEVRDYRALWNDQGIGIVAFQSMLFGREDLLVFGDDAVRRETIDYLARFIELAGRLGAGVLVFGSPRNRRVPDGMSPAEADDIAAGFFAKLGQIAVDNDTVFCIEPNPVAYDCNFVVDAAHGLGLVSRVAHPGFGLHLDAAGMTLAGDDLYDSVVAAASWLRHFHASAPFLGVLEDEVVRHDRAARALTDIGYDRTVSIEMRPAAEGGNVERIAAALDVAERYY